MDTLDRNVAAILDLEAAGIGIEALLAVWLGRIAANTTPATPTVARPTLPATPGHGVPALGTANMPTARTVLSLPISPQVLNDMATAANLTGQIVKHLNTETMIVPAGETVTLALSGNGTTVMVFVLPISIQSTYYDPMVTAQVLVDDQPIITAGAIFSVQGPSKISLGQFYYVRQSITITIVNESQEDLLMFGENEFLTIDTAYFETVFAPLLARGMQELQSAAQGEYTGGGTV